MSLILSLLLVKAKNGLAHSSGVVSLPASLFPTINIRLARLDDATTRNCRKKSSFVFSEKLRVSYHFWPLPSNQQQQSPDT
jgi:hypothetical protein